MTKELKAILPCPFCGEIPFISKSYAPAYLSIECTNEDCQVRPYLEIPVSCKANDDGLTFSPQFEKHESEIIEIWNKRAGE
ncbi:Lar family restriction alleviation protein [Parabacteroides provencensis]|uniref:Lar family restriction alleviation protein n=1 Tax=Parabacteroides provencensis TaxID=1944636 RepID=UPI000C150243|nr:Lar family restriction alleviation protein [Parabacteroides provencensis]